METMNYKETLDYCNKCLHNAIGHILFEMTSNKRLTNIPWVKDYLLDLSFDVDEKIM